MATVLVLVIALAVLGVHTARVKTLLKRSQDEVVFYKEQLQLLNYAIDQAHARLNAQSIALADAQALAASKAAPIKEKAQVIIKTVPTTTDDCKATRDLLDRELP